MINDKNFKPLAEGVTLYPGQRVIRIGNRMFPVGIGNNSMPAKGGNSMEFYKCAAVSGLEDAYLVSGAGTEAVNGNYLKTGQTYSGQDIWKHETADYYMFFDNVNAYPNRWIIADNCPPNSFTTLYALIVTTDNPAQPGWSYSSGLREPPTVSKTQIRTGEDTWSGYKAVLTDGVYSFEETVTEGLSYTIITPKVDGIYSADALVTVSNLYDGTDPHTLLYFTMDDKGSVAVDKINGITLKPTGNMVSGVPGIKNTAWSADTQSSYLSGNQEVFELPQELTLNAFMRYTSISTNTYVNAPIVEFGSWDNYTGFGLWLGKEAKVTGHIDQGTGYNFGSVVLSPNVWYMVTMTYDGSYMKTYINGTVDTNVSYSGTVRQDKLIATFSRGPGGGSTSECWAGQIDEVSLLDYAMTDEQVADLYEKLTGSSNKPTEPDTGDKNYAYTVSGFSANTEAANGDYYEVNPDSVYSTVSRDKGIYYNGSYYLCYVNDAWNGWCIVRDIAADPVSQNAADRPAVSPSAETPDKADWGAYTGTLDYKVTAYAGDSGSDKTYVYTVSGAGTSEVNGDYWDVGETKCGKPVYTNGNVYMCYDTSIDIFPGWFISETVAGCAPPSSLYASNTDTATPNESTWDTGDHGQAPAPTVTPYAG